MAIYNLHIEGTHHPLHVHTRSPRLRGTEYMEFYAQGTTFSSPLQQAWASAEVIIKHLHVAGGVCVCTEGHALCILHILHAPQPMALCVYM